MRLEFSARFRYLSSLPLLLHECGWKLRIHIRNKSIIHFFNKPHKRQRLWVHFWKVLATKAQMNLLSVPRPLRRNQRSAGYKNDLKMKQNDQQQFLVQRLFICRSAFREWFPPAQKMPIPQCCVGLEWFNLHTWGALAACLARTISRRPQEQACASVILISSINHRKVIKLRSPQPRAQIWNWIRQPSVKLCASLSCSPPRSLLEKRYILIPPLRAAGRGTPSEVRTTKWHRRTNFWSLYVDIKPQLTRERGRSPPVEFALVPCIF